MTRQPPLMGDDAYRQSTSGGRLAGTAPGTGTGDMSATAVAGEPPAAADPTLSGPGRRQPGQPAGDRARRRSADPWRTAFFGVLIIAILAGAAWAVLGSSLLVVRHIDVRGDRLVSAAQVRSAARIPVGQPLARVNTAGAAHRVDQITAVLSASVSRSWPDTIVITVQERTPALSVAARDGYDLVDEYGVTVRWAARQPAGLPLLTSPPAVLRGSPDVRAAALVLRQLPSALRARVVSLAAASATTVTLHLTRGVTVLWGAPGLAGQKAAELDLLLPRHARFYDVSDPSTAVTQG